MRGAHTDTSFWQHVAKSEDGCWLWTGYSEDGYGRLGHLLAHVIAYEAVYGPVPAGLELDHLCRTTLCVRPDHLEAVTHAVNVLRGHSFAAINASKTHCPQGHPYDAENVGADRADGRGRYCRTCKRIRNREHMREVRAA